MRSFFNEKAEGYDDVHGEKHLFDTKIALVDRIPDGCRNFLDLGVGTGLELTLLFEKIPSAHVTGIDISENMLHQLSKRSFADKITVINGDFFEVDFVGAPFDAVITSSALHHFTPDDKARLYEKIFASLRSGGCFISADCICSELSEERWTFDNYAELLKEWRHVDTPLSKETEIRLLEAADFKNITVTDLENEKYKLIYAEKK